MILLDTLAPVFVIALLGYALGRASEGLVAPLAKVAFFVLTPSLIMNTLLTGSISAADAGTIALFVFIVHGGLFAGTWAVGRFRGWGRERSVASSLVMSCSNVGNFGLPVLLFAFGEQGFALGVVYVVAHQAFQLMFPLGVAAWEEGQGVKVWVKKILSVPWIYAFAVALLLRGTGGDLPRFLGRPLAMMAQAAIPVQLLILGMQLSRVKFKGMLADVAGLSAAKLLIPPILALGVAELLGVHGILRGVLVLEASAPAAVNAIIISLQYNRDPRLVSGTLLVTTLGSVMTISALLLYLT